MLPAAPGSSGLLALIVLGIDPGTAATGYGIVERTGSKLRALDYGCLETLSTQALPQRLLEIHQGDPGPDRRPTSPTLRRRRAAVLQQERP